MAGGKVKRKQLLEWIWERHDPGPCRFDHHGYCQEHWDMGKDFKCSNQEIRDMFTALGWYE